MELANFLKKLVKNLKYVRLFHKIMKRNSFLMKILLNEFSKTKLKVICVCIQENMQ